MKNFKYFLLPMLTILSLLCLSNHLFYKWEFYQRVNENDALYRETTVTNLHQIPYRNLHQRSIRFQNFEYVAESNRILGIETKNKSRASKQYFKVVRTISSDYNQAFQDKPSTAIRLRGTSCARFNHLNRIGKFRIENFSSLRRIKRDVQVYFDRTGDGKYINEDKEKNVCTVDDIKVERKTTRKATNFRYNFNSRVYNQNVRIDFDSKMNQKRRNRFDPNNRLMIRKEKQNELNVESNSVDQMLLRELRFTSGREILLKRNYQVAQRSQLLVRKKSEHQLVPHIIKAPRDQNWYINLERTAKLNDHGIFYNSYDNSNGEMNLRPVPKSIYISKVLSFIGFQRTFTADMILNTQHILSTLISWNYGLTILSGIFIYDFIKEVTQKKEKLQKKFDRKLINNLILATKKAVIHIQE